MAKKNRIALSAFDNIPSGMREYLQHYGYHFSKKMAEDAIKHMYKKSDPNGKEEKVESIAKEKLEEMLKKHNITVDNDVMYDGVYIYGMIQADFWGKSIKTEQDAMMHIKCMLDDVDQPDGYVFNRYYADRCFSGEPIDWEEMM
jgi:ribosomal protein L9